MRKELTGSRSGSRSLGRLREATLRLLDERSPESITVTDIVTEAGVTRPTFYAAFGDLPTAFADAALSRLEEAFAGMTLTPAVPEAERSAAMEAAFLGILRRLEPHADFFARALRGPGGIEVHVRAVDFLATRLRESSPLSPDLARGPLSPGTASTSLAAGVVWTILVHLGEEDRRPVTELAPVLRDLVLHTVVGGLGRPAPSADPADPTPEES
ncbi:hypothetical protein GCM10028787_26090 [Brachybacterium horti]